MQPFRNAQNGINQIGLRAGEITNATAKNARAIV
jgi:hypothetical protein